MFFVEICICLGYCLSGNSSLVNITSTVDFISAVALNRLQIS